MLLDRSADVYLAQQSAADSWLIKPLDALRLRRAALTLLEGGTVQEGVAATAP
jgi:two-component system nitrate/nitrite response regulator NarL